MSEVISARKPLLPQSNRPVPPTPTPDVHAIARSQGFDKSGLPSQYRDAGRIIRNRAPRDAQLILKVTTDTARWMRDHANETGLSLPDILEKAIALYRAEQG